MASNDDNKFSLVQVHLGGFGNLSTSLYYPVSLNNQWHDIFKVTGILMYT
jgi:hypothetical protein